MGYLMGHPIQRLVDRLVVLVEHSAHRKSDEGSRTADAEAREVIHDAGKQYKHWPGAEYCSNNFRQL